MKKLFLFASALVLGVSVFAQQAQKAEDVLKFKELAYDFGKIKQGTPVSHDFVFSNTSDNPVIIESAMSFLGFGLPPPTPTWGWTLAYGTRFIRDEPWLSIVSGATIMVTVLGFNLLGDGLRDILDPRQLTRASK